MQGFRGRVDELTLAADFTAEEAELVLGGFLERVEEGGVGGG